MRRAAAIVILVAVGDLLSGCSWSPTMSALGGRVAPDTFTLADRCAEIMTKAMPFAKIDIGDRTSQSPNIRTIIAKVTGARTDMEGNNQVERDLEVECTFTDNVLTAFRWTKGGPPQH
jgi:hypothetical protein